MDLSNVTPQAPKLTLLELTAETHTRLAELCSQALTPLQACKLSLHTGTTLLLVVGSCDTAERLSQEICVGGQCFGLTATLDQTHEQANHVFNALVLSVTIILELEYKLVSAQQQHTQHLAYQQALWDGSTEALIYFNEAGQIHAANQKAQTLLGYDLARLLGLNIAALLPSNWRDEREEFIALSPDQERDVPLLGWRATLMMARADGVRIPVVVNTRQMVWPGQTEPEYIAFIRTLRSTQALDEQISERALLQTIIDAIPDPIYARDRGGNYLIANQSSQTYIQPVVAGATAGGPFQELYRQAVADSENAHAKVLSTGEVVYLEFQEPNGNRYTVSKSPIFTADGSIDGVVSVAHNVTAFWHATMLLEKQRHLLSVLHKGLTDYGTLFSSNKLWSFLKHALKDLTGSQYALLGEIQSTAHRPKLKVHEISDLAWNDASRALMQKLRTGEMLIDSPDSLLGQCYVHGQVVLNNDLASLKTRFPPGHPALSNYLAVPITDGDSILGMYAIANSHDPYTHKLVEWLEPFTSTCSLLIKLQRQMDEQARTNDALIRAHHEAERASQAKTDFLSSMSHELRTPLNAIMGFAQLLVGRNQNDSRTRRQAEHILNSGHHLLELINEILDLARIESGHLALSLEKIHLTDVLQSTIDSLHGMAKQYDVHLDIDPNMGRNVWVHADFTRLRQVLDNLLSNAIKYNRPKGTARVRLSQLDDRIKVAVSDTGLGIPQDKHSLIFTPFNRLGAENGAIEGTGVGLALTKKIIEHMQGEIGFTSQENKGSTFWFSLPISEPAPTQTITPSQWKPEDVIVGETGFRVLYVEDNPANLRLMQDIFVELDGFELLAARDGLMGLEMAQQQMPDLILMDINLPGLSGYQVLTLLRADARTAEIPVVGLSANAMGRDIQAAYDAGFTTYLTKPLDLGELFKHLESFKAARDQRPQ